jgi:hypothetical protein
MALFSAADDFSRRTLAALPGLLAKLQYVSGLRRDDGQYAHWGLARVYGEHAARQAIEGIHKDLTLQVLRTPLRELVEDAIQSAENAETDVAEYLWVFCHVGFFLASESTLRFAGSQSLQGGLQRCSSYLGSTANPSSSAQPLRSRWLK